MHFRKVAWLELYNIERSKLNQRGGGFAMEFSPLPDQPPTISQAGLNLNQYRYHGHAQQKGTYFQIIYPCAENCKSMVRPAIEKRYI